MTGTTPNNAETTGEAVAYLTAHGFTRHPEADRYSHRYGYATVDVVDAEAACFTVTAFTRDRARLIMWQAQLYKAPLPVFTATIYRRNRGVIMTDNEIQMIDTWDKITTDRREYTWIYKVGADTVRIRIRHDYYEFQSFALAQVLTPSREWTSLAEEPTSKWFQSLTVKDPNYLTTMIEMADALAHRAAEVLA